MDEQERLEIYKNAGIDYDRGLDRFMGKATLYRKFLEKFLYDASFEEFRAGLATHDMLVAEQAVHTLKGTAANLSLNRVFNAADAMVKAIRRHADDATLEQLAADVEATYFEACDAIRQTM